MREPPVCVDFVLRRKSRLQQQIQQIRVVVFEAIAAPRAFAKRVHISGLDIEQGVFRQVRDGEIVWNIFQNRPVFPVRAVTEIRSEDFRPAIIPGARDADRKAGAVGLYVNAGDGFRRAFPVGPGAEILPIGLDEVVPEAALPAIPPGQLDIVDVLDAVRIVEIGFVVPDVPAFAIAEHLHDQGGDRRVVGIDPAVRGVQRRIGAVGFADEPLRRAQLPVLVFRADLGVLVAAGVPAFGADQGLVDIAELLVFRIAVRGGIRRRGQLFAVQANGGQDDKRLDLIAMTAIRAPPLAGLDLAGVIEAGLHQGGVEIRLFGVRIIRVQRHERADHDIHLVVAVAVMVFVGMDVARRIGGCRPADESRGLVEIVRADVDLMLDGRDILQFREIQIIRRVI